MHTTFVIWDNNLSSDGLYLLKRERSPKLCLLKNKSSGVPQPVVFPEAWLPLWPRSLYWLTVKRGCVIQFYLSKSPILSGRNIISASELYSSMIKGLFHPIHGLVSLLLGGDLTLFSPPIFGDSSSKLAFIVKKRVAWTAQKMSLGPGGEIRAELHMVMVLVVLGLRHTNPRSQVSTYLETTCN